MKDDVILGHISAAHGIRGWIKVHSHCQPRQNVFNYQPWRVQKPSGECSLVKVLKSQSNGKTLIAQIEGCTDRDTAETWIGSQIFVEKGQLPVLGSGEFYWRDLLGMTVINQRQECLGRVSSFMETGANDVLVVSPEAQDSYNGDRLIPYLFGQVVKSVDTVRKVIEVDWDSDF